MSWDDISKLVLAILASFGGVSSIFIITIKYSSNIIAKRLEEKYKFKMNKELEKYKSRLCNKTYISKAKFDVEFSIYRKLSSEFFNIVEDICILIPEGIATSKEDKDVEYEWNGEIYNRVKMNINYAKEELYSNSPFIPGEIFEKYHEILKYCQMQIKIYDERTRYEKYFTEKQKEELSVKDNRRIKELNEKFKKLNDDVREYLFNLDILE